MVVGIHKNFNGEHLAFKYWPLLYLIVTFCVTLFIFSDGLGHMLLDWQREEFSHGYMIPLVSVYLLLQKLPELAKVKSNHQIWGVVVVVVGILLYIVGELSALYPIIQYGFIVVLTGIAISLLGIRGALVIGAPIAYLLFMIPLPNFLYLNLSSNLQLLSSSIGVTILRLFNISVFLEGNVIDLGSLRLQVVDACSGLRYLFPLMSFGFLVAYIYRAPLWKKMFIFFSTIPITILMNSFRIAVIGVTVDIWGVAAAEGLVHDFEGWVVFLACLGLLALEILILHRLSGNRASPLDSISVSLPTPLFSKEYFAPMSKISLSAIIVLIVLFISVSLKFVIADRVERIPPRSNFSEMPLAIGSWTGREGHFDQDVIEALKLKDYFLADYIDATSGAVVNLYVVYYDSQRKGASVHSPKTCMPGGGWELSQQAQLELNYIESYRGKSLMVNRVVIQKGSAKSLVYYWFQQRGRIITNEYLAKWYIFWDALTRNRTDGALVRITIEYSGSEETEKHLQNFVENLAPLLPKFIPE